MSRKRPVSKEFMFSSIMEPFTTTQRLLYVYCIIDADDDGIVGNIDVIRHQIKKCNNADIQALVNGGLLLYLGNGIYAIRDWWTHNDWNYRTKRGYKATIHQAEASRLQYDEVTHVYSLRTDYGTYGAVYGQAEHQEEAMCGQFEEHLKEKESFNNNENFDSIHHYNTLKDITSDCIAVDCNGESAEEPKQESKESIAEHFHFYPGYEDEEDEVIAESFLSLEADPLEDDIYPFSMDTETAEETVDSDPCESLKEEQTEHERADISNDKGYQEYKLEHPDALYTDYLLERKRNNASA